MEAVQQELQQGNPNLISEPAEVNFTLTIKRADTGIEETVNMVGHILPTPETPLP